MALRQQSAIEFMSVYSFAIFVIAIMLISAVTISLSAGNGTPVYSSCNIQPLIPCQTSLLTYNSASGFNYVVVFRNDLGFQLQFPASGAINMSLSTLVSSANQVNFGNCLPTNVVQGSQAICIVHISGKSQIKQGTNSYTQFRLTYGLCTNQSEVTCTSANGIYYTATGFSFQTLSPPVTNIYNVSIQSTNGVVVLNEETYLNNTPVYLISGSYTVYAQPGAGHTFNSLAWTGNTPWTESVSPSNTFTVSSAGNIIATFH